jgi:hypothetical protein
MGKKSSDTGEPGKKKGRKGLIPFSFLSHQFDTIDENTAKRHLLYLALASVAAKLLVIFVTTVMFRSFIDYFDIGVYLEHVQMVLQGQSPFSGEFQYPILIFVPLLIAMVPALLFQNALAFVFTFQVLMVICDIVTILCVYLIALRLWDERTAFLAGIIYAAAFTAAYFVITKYDAFPTCLLMLAILFTVYRQEVKGYAVSVLGFFTKVFPVLALPFFVLYNAKRTSLRQEIIAAAKVAVPIGVVLFLPLFILMPETFRIYVPIRSELGYYSNTLTFTIYSWLHDVFKIGVSLDMVSAVMYAGMGVGILALLYAAWVIPGRDLKLTLKLILCATILVVVCAKVRSPQYIVWFTPLLCLLAADDLRKIVALFVFQALAYAEFPLMFGNFYTALKYTNETLSSGWMITLVMFTLEYLALFACVWLVVNPPEIFRRVRQAAGKKETAENPAE